MSELFDSPFVVPVAGTVMILGIVIAAKVNEYGVRRLQSEERLAAIAKGVPLPELPVVPFNDENWQVRMRIRMGNVRRGGIVLVASGIGIAIFFCVLSWVLRERDVLSGAAAAIIPLAIGAGLLIDARMQSEEMQKNPLPSETYSSR